MNYNELKQKMSEWNKTYYTRFIVVKGKQLKILGHEKTFNFTPDNYEDVLFEINKYSYFKPDSECLGLELYRKGLKWRSLTKAQKFSTVEKYLKEDCYYDNSKIIQKLWPDKEEFLEWCFEDNMAPLAIY